MPGMRATTRPCWRRSIVSWPTCALLALLPLTLARPVRAATPTQETLIVALYDGLGYRAELDANEDRILTVADILLLPPEIPPAPTDTPTPTPTATLTPTSTPTETETQIPTMTLTPTPTATETETPTPIGLIFAGTVADLLPHGVGDQLVYRVTSPRGIITTETTTATSSDPDGAFVIDDKEVDSHQRAVKHELQSYTDTGSELLFDGFTDLLLNTRTTCAPPLLRLTTPLVAGQDFSTTIRCNVYFANSGAYIGWVDRTDTFTPIEVVDSLVVPAGTYTRVVHIHGSTNQSGELESDEIYLASGVGPILQLATFGTQTTRRELVSGTVGGQPVVR